MPTTTTNSAKTDTGSKTTTSNNNPSASDSLWGICGIHEPFVSDHHLPTCGESMLSKVSTLFGGGNTKCNDQEGRDEISNAADVTLASTESSAAEDLKALESHQVTVEDVASDNVTTPKPKPKNKNKTKVENKDGADAAIEFPVKEKPQKIKKKSIMENGKEKEKGHQSSSPASTGTPTKKKKKSIKKSTHNNNDDDAAVSPAGSGSSSKTTKSPKTKRRGKVKHSKRTSTMEDPSSPSASSNKGTEELLQSNDSTKNNNNNHDHNEHGDDDVDKDDVDAMLAKLEIPDFGMSMEELPDGQGDDEAAVTAAAANNSQRPWENVNWKERIQRDEVFSRRYKPKQTEHRELEAMAQLLGLAKSSSDFLSMGKRMSMTIGMGSQVTEDIHNLLYGGHSILLSILPVQWDGNKCELLLLTDGFVLKYQKKSNSYNPLEKRYETCHLWDAVEYCERSSPLVVSLQIHKSTKYELEAQTDGESLETILGQLESIMTHHDMFSSQNHRTDILGWQYLRIRKPAFTAAVKNDPKLLPSNKQRQQNVVNGINKLDSYNQFAPLHYAVLQDECNINVIKGLLRCGADPNLEDGDGRSPMYYAERHELPEEVLEVLKNGGGTKSKLAEMEMKGELFGGVDEANVRSGQRRERERIVKEHEQDMKDQKAAEAQAKAEGAQSEMSKAMSALVERGEKIEKMDQKTKDLEAEAKTYGDLAAKLKDQVKNKKWYQL